jgi:hypothetical protein
MNFIGILRNLIKQIILFISIILSVLSVGCIETPNKSMALNKKIPFDSEDIFLNQNSIVYMINVYDRTAKKWIHNIYNYNLNSKFEKKIENFKNNEIVFLSDNDEVISKRYIEEDKKMELISYNLKDGTYETIFRANFPFTFINSDKDSIYISTDNELYFNEIGKEKIIYRADNSHNVSVYWEYTNKSYQIMDICNDKILYKDLTDLDCTKYSIYDSLSKSEYKIIENNDKTFLHHVKGFYKNNNFLIGTIHDKSAIEDNYKIFIYDIVNRKKEIVCEGILIAYNTSTIVYRKNNSASYQILHLN